jgi:imidazolonepropionase-like amidohydrolase
MTTLPALPVGSGGLRLIHVRVIDGNGGPPIQDGEIVFRDGRLTFVGLYRPEAPAEDETLPTEDATGCTALPGFIDCHVHFSAGAFAQWQALGMFSSHFHLLAADNMRRTLDAGITTARDLAGVDAGFREAMRMGALVGPRLNIAIGAISPTGGHTDFVLPNGNTIPLAPRDFSNVADSDDEVRVVVRRLLRSGADVIKVCASGGITSVTTDPDDIGMPERQIGLIREELERRGGRPIAAHAEGADGILAAVRGGVSSVEHGYGITAEALEMMIEKGTYLVPTLSSALQVPDRRLVPSYIHDKKRRWATIARERLAAAVASGVKIALGTDSGACPHGRNLGELGHLVDLGMSPMRAIMAGTRVAAELLGYGDHIGTIEPGKWADLVLVNVDPIRDIRALAEPDAIRVVIQAGRVVKDLNQWPNVGHLARRDTT